MIRFVGNVQVHMVHTEESKVAFVVTFRCESQLESGQLDRIDWWATVSQVSSGLQSNAEMIVTSTCNHKAGLCSPRHGPMLLSTRKYVQHFQFETKL